MILCETILVATITVSVVTITGLIFGHYHTMSSLIKQIKQLEDKVHLLNEKLAQVQMKILDLNEISGI